MTSNSPNQPSTQKIPLHLGVAAKLRAYFFAGILITAPISITFYIAWQFIKFMDAQVSPLIPPSLQGHFVGIPGFGLVLTVVGLTLLGAVTAGFVGRILTKLYELILDRTPVIRSIYSAVKQIFETILANKAEAFREVVMIQYPRPGIWTIGFITGRAAEVVQRQFSQEMVNVFVPTTPNPTSGFLLFLPRNEVQVLEMSVEDGLKLVISTGIIAPPYRKIPAEIIQT